ncbi:MAG: acetate kinase [Mycoplasmataceae bacterium]|jgi:acetate kinase|nr:acetate kinase [Mycoplasmataceae bacterium]
MSNKLLIINAGSSSVKFKVFEAETKKVITSGLCERIFVDGHFEMKFNDKKIELNYAMPSHTEAINCILEQLKNNNIINDFSEIIGVGHRVVLAGEKISESCETTEQVKQAVKDHIKLAPLHNEPELKVVEIFEKLLPKAVSVASFDNAYHLTIPVQNYTYAIDKNVAKKYEIRRYGFHGNSYRFINKRMSIILNKNDLNLIVCHLGNGASMCAIKNGKSFDTSMGLTPLEGLVMGTRCGDVDPSMSIYLIRQGMKPDEVDALFNKKSGLLGLTGTSDMRDITSKYESNDQDAKLAVHIYANRVASYIIKYANELENDVDAIVFTAGVGENSTFIIQQIINKVKLINLKLSNESLNKKYDDYKLISDKASTYPIYCVRTDEELMIAEDLLKIIKDKNVSK